MQKTTLNLEVMTTFEDLGYDTVNAFNESFSLDSILRGQ